MEKNMDRKLMMKKLSKSKFFYVVCILTLSIVSAFCVYAASISFYRVNASQITKTSARVSAKISNPSKMFMSTVGVYIGPAGDMKKIEETVNSRTITDMWYDTGKWYGELQPGTEYHYQFYVIADGVEYKSQDQTFRTEAEPALPAAGVSGIGQMQFPANNTPTFPEGFYLHQTSSVSCTFFATLNMVRSKAFLEGRNYTLLNERSVEGYAWVNGEGLAARPITIPLIDGAGRRDYTVIQGDYWSFGDGNYIRIQNLSVDQKKEMLKSMLAEHPEGIVIWDAVGHTTITGATTTHAAVLTNYDANTGIFYVADSGSVDSFTVPNGPEGNVAYTAKRELRYVSFFGGEGQDEKIKSITRVLFVN